jgi:DNA-binding transcriptional ArsR family regulator
MAPDRRSLLIAPSASGLRRHLGPTAWFVFEELAASSTRCPPLNEVVATTRSLAETLGLSKDTVARALSKLRRAGLIEARQDRTSAGAFTAGRYSVVLPACVHLTHNPPAQAADATPVASNRTAEQQRSVQLSLLDPAAITTL